MTPLLRVNNLVMYYGTLRGYVKAVDDISFEVNKGDAVGLAGESGCGKTSAALTIMRLLPLNGKIIRGEILFENKDLLKLSEKELNREIRWKKISMIFQGAMNSLHPTKRIGAQISDAIIYHEEVDKDEAYKRAEALLDLVGVGASRIDRYPHELSGGMKQRTIIAMALACNPRLVIADEPTTALDVIVAAQVLELVKDLQRKLNLSLILISHDLSNIAEICNKVAIMYAGKIVEFGTVEAVYKEPLHPYTQKLIAAFPSILGNRREFVRIHGFPPDLLNPPSGCRFHPRCEFAMDICKRNEPKSVYVDSKGHQVACHLIKGGEKDG